MNVRERLLNCIENFNIQIDGDKIDVEQISSLEFVSLFVEIENEFSIEIPDEYLSLEALSSLNFIANVVEMVLLQKEKCTNT